MKVLRSIYATFTRILIQLRVAGLQVWGRVHERDCRACLVRSSHRFANFANHWRTTHREVSTARPSITAEFFVVYGYNRARPFTNSKLSTWNLPLFSKPGVPFFSCY